MKKMRERNKRIRVIKRKEWLGLGTWGDYSWYNKDRINYLKKTEKRSAYVIYIYI